MPKAWYSKLVDMRVSSQISFEPNLKSGLRVRLFQDQRTQLPEEPLMSPPSLPAAERYYHAALARLQHLLDSQRPALDRAAALCTDAIAADGLVHLFGCC